MLNIFQRIQLSVFLLENHFLMIILQILRIFLVYNNDYKINFELNCSSNDLRSLNMFSKKFMKFYMLDSSIYLWNIYLLRRFNKDNLNSIDMGNHVQFSENDVFVSKTTITVHGQDCFRILNLFARSKKYKKVEEFFEKPKLFEKKIADETTLFLNFGSGQSLGCYPYSAAEYVTPRIGKYVEKSYPNEFLGFIIFDFDFNRYYPKIIYNVITLLDFGLFNFWTFFLDF